MVPISYRAGSLVTACHELSRPPYPGLDEPLQEGKIMKKLTEQEASPVFGLRYLEDREVEGLDVVGCLMIDRGRGTHTGCDDADGGLLAP
jgi:hypothetical protein